jgi:hypothetical protein
VTGANANPALHQLDSLDANLECAGSTAATVLQLHAAVTTLLLSSPRCCQHSRAACCNIHCYSLPAAVLLLLLLLPLAPTLTAL